MWKKTANRIRSNIFSTKSVQILMYVVHFPCEKNLYIFLKLFYMKTYILIVIDSKETYLCFFTVNSAAGETMVWML